VVALPFTEELRRTTRYGWECVITYCDPEEPDLFVQDSTSGIWVNLEIVESNVPLKTEDLLEIERVTEAPDFALQVTARDSA